MPKGKYNPNIKYILKKERKVDLINVENVVKIDVKNDA
jgi:hypothetical protein